MVITQKEYDKEQKKKKYEIAGEKCNQSSQETKQEVNQDLYAIVKSDSHYGAYYLITGKETLNCSCPARVACKHLKNIKNGKNTSIRISRPSKS